MDTSYNTYDTYDTYDDLYDQIYENNNISYKDIKFYQNLVMWSLVILFLFFIGTITGIILYYYIFSND